MENLGIVFSGGIAKGAYQIGFCKALLEFVDIQTITTVSASSIGALNGTALITNKVRKAEELWLETNIEGVKNTIQLLTKRFFLFSKIDQLLDETCTMKKDFYVTCCELPFMSKSYFNIKDLNKEEIRKVLYASVSIPLLMEPVELNEKYYIDGAILDNVPVKPLLKHKELDLLMVVHFDPMYFNSIEVMNNFNILEICLANEERIVKDSFDLRNSSIKYMISKGYTDSLRILDLVFRKGLNDYEYIQNIIAILHRKRKVERLNADHIITCCNNVSNRVERILRKMG